MPIEVSVVTCQPLVTVLERAATSVGRSAQKLFEWSWKSAVTAVSAPSCVGTVEERALEWRARPLVSATRRPSSVGSGAV